MTPKTNYNFRDDELKSQLLPKLIGEIFHVTSYSNFTKIEKSGFIKNNAAGEFGYTYPQSEDSYGRKRGYICLFDLRDKSDEAIKHALNCFYFLGDPKLGDKQAILILSPDTFSDLVDVKQAISDGFNDMYIPEVECWYPKDLELSHIKEIVMVNIEREPISDSTKAINQAFDINIKRNV